MHKLCCLLALVLFGTAAGCAGVEPRSESAPQGLVALPRPSEIVAPDVPRTASGSLAGVTRLILNRGDEFLPFPGFSHNAFPDPATHAATILGSTSELNYCYYRINNAVVDETEMLEELTFDVDWPAGVPSAPEGLWIGVPDLTADAWVWYGPLSSGWTTLDLRDRNVHGHDPTGSSALYIAAVNCSSVDIDLRSVSGRYAHADSVDGDEWIYFENHDSGDLLDYNGIARVPAGGGAVETIFLADPTRRYARPQVVFNDGRWRLLYAYKTITPAWEMWIAELDGSSPERYRFGAIDFYPAGWRYPGNKELWLQRNGGGTVNIYAAEQGGDSGRLSDALVNVHDAVWYEQGDDTIAFGAIAAIEVDATHSALAIATAQTLPGTFSFMDLYTRQPNESAFDPHVLEATDGAGNPSYSVYFGATGRDNPTANLYQYNIDNFSVDQVFPVLDDPLLELLSPTTSPNGLHLAYVATDAGASSGALYVTRTILPQLPSELTPLVDEGVVGNVAWYDPTP